jgi:hypothetical protein
MMVAALLGAVILTDAPRVSSRVNTESSSSLVVTGIIAYTDPTQGFAIIGSSPRATYLARPGQQLPDGSRIREIHPKSVVLEHGGSLETVGMYAPARPAGATYGSSAYGPPAYVAPTYVPANAPAFVPTPSLPPQTRWENFEVKGVAPLETAPSLPRPADAPPAHPRPGDIRANETSASEERSNGPPPGEALPKQVQPGVPLPAAQDPVDESNDYRRQRAESLKENLGK